MGSEQHANGRSMDRKCETNIRDEVVLKAGFKWQ